MKTIFNSGGFIVIATMLFISLASYKYRAVQREVKICHECKSDNFKGVNLHEFIKDVARYRGTHVADIVTEMRDRTDQDSVSRMCTYSLDTLKKFICLIETYSKLSKIQPKELAMSFIYGIYPLKQTIAGQPYGSLHTLFMVPAVYDKSSNSYILFDPKATALNSYTPQYLAQHKFKKNYKYFALADLAPVARNDSANVTSFILDASAVYQQDLSAPESYTWNQGQLCPPNCPPVSFLQTVDSMYPDGCRYRQCH